MMLTDAHAKPVEEVLRALETDPEVGLSQAEAVMRLHRFGPNQLREIPPPGLLEMLWAQFNNFVVWMLIAAAVISAIIGVYAEEGYTEALAIIAIVILNAIIGMVQERRAENALRELQKMAAPEAHVLRDGRVQLVPARELVPGDVVILETGNYVPADLRLIETINLKINEAALTGESEPVRKRADLLVDADASLGDRSNLAFMGTVVTYGRGRGVVIATGMETEIGRIAELLQSYEEEETPLQRRLNHLGKLLGYATLVICGIVFGVGILRDTAVGTLLRAPLEYLQTYQEVVLELFMVAVSLAIAAVPEGLPAVVTIALALGMRRMVERHALIRRLPAVETLGSVTVICSDKTGTLTRNEMTVVQVELDGQTIHVSGEGFMPQGRFYVDGHEIDPHRNPDLQLLLRASLLASDAVLNPAGDNGREWEVVGDPTEGALVVLAAKAGLERKTLEKAQPRVAEIPFDSERKRMTTIHRLASDFGLRIANGDDEPNSPLATRHPPLAYIAYVKGAPDVILELSTHYHHRGRPAPLTEEVRERIRRANEEMANRALRVLAIAYRPLAEVPDDPHPGELERDLVFLGLVGMHDKPRPEVRPAIERARRAGIRTVMVTGDYRDTAVAVARELGLLRPESLVLTGAELQRLSDEQLAELVDRVDVYARVSPEHKVRIVEAFKRREAIVAMTGDGVNDAPALKRAHIGIAMGITGTDVARETADMVLTDDNYASIVAAVEEGRVIYDNIRKFVYYLLSCNVGEILIIFSAILAGLPSPLRPIQLLWVNLVTDGLPALALGMEKGEPDIMERPPRPPQQPILTRWLWSLIGIQAVVDAMATVTAFVWALWTSGYDVRFAQTVAFATLVMAELLRAYTSRSERLSLWHLGPLTNRWMLVATASSTLLLLAVIYVPFLQPVFSTVALDRSVWLVILPLMALPALAAEVAKLFIRRWPPDTGNTAEDRGRPVCRTAEGVPS